MKQISIVTWYGGINYGTSLQALALQKKLSLLGYDAYLLNPFSTKISLLTIIKNAIGRLGLYERCKNIKLYIMNRSQLKSFNKEFRVKYVFSNNDYVRLLKETYVFISGSDQIWNTFYCYNPFYFLDFVTEGKKIAYASSIGTTAVREQYREQVKSHLLKFAHIGVRECSSVNVLSNLTGRNDIIQVLDPTFLIKPQEWLQICNNTKSGVKIEEPYLLCYLIGKNECYKDDLALVCKKCGLKRVVIIPSAENPNFSFSDAYIYKKATPLDFVYLIAHASYVCTDSFHATAFAINFSKQFVEFLRFKITDEDSQNSRINDLLRHYGLLHKIFSCKSNNCFETINYDRVQKQLENDRQLSEHFLINSIED